jgi:hypothetical protein
MQLGCAVPPPQPRCRSQATQLHHLVRVHARSVSTSLKPMPSRATTPSTAPTTDALLRAASASPPRVAAPSRSAKPASSSRLQLVCPCLDEATDADHTVLLLDVVLRPRSTDLAASSVRSRERATKHTPTVTTTVSCPVSQRRAFTTTAQRHCRRAMSFLATATSGMCPATVAVSARLHPSFLGLP